MSRPSATQIAPPDEALAEDAGPIRWPFQKRVDQVAEKRFDAEIKAGATGRRDMEGVEPRLQLSMIYHNVRRAGLWKEGGAARVAFVGRLVADGIPKRVANSLAWRLIEDALCGCEGEDGLDATILAAELDAMLAYGKERNYPAAASREEIAAALRDRDMLFPEGTPSTRLPTTVLRMYQRLGLWDLAKRVLERLDPDRGQIGDRSTSGAWRMLGDVLSSNRSVPEIRDALRIRIREQK